MSKLKDCAKRYEGIVFKTGNYGDLKVLKYNTAKNVEVVFIDTGYKTVTSIANIQRNSVKDRLKPTVLGVGVLGGSFSRINGVVTREYSFWEKMLSRCYSDAYLTKRPSYIECEVSEGFKYLPKFENWCREQIGFNNKGWHLDKDILVKGNKVYSEDTCCFVPSEINNLMVTQHSSRGDNHIGVATVERSNKYRATLRDKHLGVFTTEEDAFYAYKEAKELKIKAIADKWKDHICPRVYESLISWEVCVND